MPWWLNMIVWLFVVAVTVMAVMLYLHYSTIAGFAPSFGNLT